MTNHSLQALLDPAAVAVVGVSEDPGGVGRRVYENIRAGGYLGTLFAVNTRAVRIGDQRSWPSVAELPEPVDLAVIAVPAKHVPGVIEDCGRRGVGHAIVLSAGFAETGERGAALQRELLEVANHARVRVLGPNCLGVMRAPSSLNASFSAGIALPGKLALLSQSGAVCSAIVDWAQRRRVGFSTAVSLGAAADVRMGELLSLLARDPHTDAILLYVEGVDDARTFLAGLREAARDKPVVVVKSGRHARSERAVVAHTGAIVGNDAVFDAALRHTGAVRVPDLEALFGAAEALAHTERARGERLAVITNAGGLGVLAVDRAADLGVPLATLTDETHDALEKLLPAYAGRNNPVDILGDAPPERFGKALDLCLRDANVDGVAVLLSPQLMTRPLEVAAAIAAREDRSPIPILAAFMGGRQIEAGTELLFERKVSCFDSPEEAVQAFDTLMRVHAAQARARSNAPGEEARREHDVTTAHNAVAGARAQGRHVLSQSESKALLRAFGIRIVPSERAADADQALVVARKLGFPVAMKIDSPDITHKRDVEGVRLGLADAAQLKEAFDAMLSSVREHVPEARIEGVMIEPMVTLEDSRELLVGLSHDPAFGAALAFGAGGTWVELLGPPSIELPPIDRARARSLIENSTMAPLLGPARGMQAVDLRAVEDVLLRVSDLALTLPEIVELDINPLVASPEGAIAIDARVVLSTTEPT